MRFKITAFLLLSCLFGCISKTEVPNDIIQISEMSKISAELITAETVAYTSKIPKDSQKVMYLEHYKPSILKLNGVSPSMYDSSLTFYNKHPKLLQEVTESAELMLKQRLDDFNANKESK